MNHDYAWPANGPSQVRILVDALSPAGSSPGTQPTSSPAHRSGKSNASGAMSDKLSGTRCITRRYATLRPNGPTACRWSTRLVDIGSGAGSLLALQRTLHPDAKAEAGSRLWTAQSSTDSSGSIATPLAEPRCLVRRRIVGPNQPYKPGCWRVSGSRVP